VCLQVVFAGTQYVLGDLSVIVGGMTRRTNDLQQIGVFMTLQHHEGCMMSRLDSVLMELLKLVHETARRAISGLKYDRSAPPALKSMGDYYTPCHEALCYHQLAM
jgi:hypothetical protein